MQISKPVIFFSASVADCEEAVKVFLLTKMRDFILELPTSQFLSQVLAKLNHPNIIHFKESFMEDQALCIVTSYCDGGDLFSKIREYADAGQLFSEDEIMEVFLQASLKLPPYILSTANVVDKI